MISVNVHFLVDNSLLPEGAQLSTRAFAKGWGLYKSGKLQEALIMLLKADSCRVFYNALLASHIDTVKNVLAVQGSPKSDTGQNTN